MLKTYTSWFVPISIAVTIIFAIMTFALSVVTLIIRAKVNKKYDRGKLNA
ncbi:hypothetical protein FHR92_001838 [Fontibacillus solani]|uniref:Uncharacterized protein n=2 Tax=Fontibacillus TaxID=995014 RepID=A0A1G7SIE2_9BACL|nr:hypothetical protein [Fontibacillus solani]SDG22741.1 hypothetical protein SAMN04488542_13043 [Fontibacillus panacisegetis]